MSQVPELLPWHDAPWRRLRSMMEASRVHHALLLCGPAGVGKGQFSERASMALLCEAAGERPCGECRSCRLGLAGSHPDRIDIAPEQDKRIIGVDQVRSRLSELVLTPHYAGRRVAVVNPADALNRHAADALLKTLEEPTASVVFLLVSSRPTALPVTVRSRCLRLAFHPANDEQATAWLVDQGRNVSELAPLLQWCGGAPLAVAQALDEQRASAVEALGAELEDLLQGRLGAMAVAERWRKAGLAQMVDWQLRIVTGLMRRAAGSEDGASRLATQRISRKLDLKGLNTLCEHLLELRAAGERQLNPNEQLGLEHLAASWIALRRQQS